MAFMAAAVPLISAGASILGGLMAAKGNKTEAPPPVSSPAPMPSADDAAVRAARRRSIQEQQARQGRESTILTEAASERLGG